MRRLGLALALAVTLAACAVAVDAAAGPAAPAVSGNCGPDALVVLFWPAGHGAVPSIGFPVMAKPHAELYRFAGSRTYLRANYRGFVGVDGRPELKCPAAGAFAGTPRPLGPRVTRTAKAAISCGFQGAATAQLVKSAGLWRLRLVETGNRSVLEVVLAARGSTVSYAPSRCRSGRAPA